MTKSRLDSYLAIIEKNKLKDENIETHEISLPDFPEKLQMKTLNGTQKKEFVYSLKADYQNVGEMVNTQYFKKTLYEILDLKDIAIKAKEAGAIKSYYEVVDALFSAKDMIELFGFVVSFNETMVDSDKTAEIKN